MIKMQGPPPDESSWDTRRWNTHPAQGKAGLLPSSPLSPSLLSSAFLDIDSSRSDGNRTRKMKSKSKLKVSYCLKMVQLKINNSLIHRGIFCMYYKASQNWRLTANVKQLVFFDSTISWDMISPHSSKVSSLAWELPSLPSLLGLQTSPQFKQLYPH